MRPTKRRLHLPPEPTQDNLRVKIAFTTSDRQTVDQHFGSAKGVLIYGIYSTEWHLMEAIEYSSSGFAHDKLPSRIADLSGCAVLFCNACGALAIRQLIECDIQPVKVSEGCHIHFLLTEVMAELNGTQTGWLSRALKKNKLPDLSDTQKRLTQLMDEEW
ncbi:nitrogen fixation protein NifX [Vibrio cincinnatiensis]|jgi:nitrogen fixation protein NifX|uniref:Nitrogen fixation protein NifX n=1 Tax=Vibrio cincinnatiensis DSM 19608 TaxID=1123491 RepID=A0A1T4K799_VIBCI|nr:MULTISPECIES: NifB/NifX family molybdenum-iron cluster-binding protein [Vibrio]MBE3666692.1 nitrogen fixation protein NifX [Vibrio navarrensis]MCG3723240.1 nitrogen fixation protein NifX [Vibrio cincinnatiensis]MCG3724268.1 nitrogen fixation protein NifX [Vibrio cincinnatiensis]MCG3731356.1 nitrogen fixation protein NifX [Vibrio cincinnatiensis]MCG3738869.1 nitrogen fixation protein NifX [Vibrio cincinnatiensis]